MEKTTHVSSRDGSKVFEPGRCELRDSVVLSFAVSLGAPWLMSPTFALID